MFSWIVEIPLNVALLKLAFGAFVAFILSTKFFKMILERKCKSSRVSQKTISIEEAIENWNPKALIDDTFPNNMVDDENVVTSMATKYVEVNGIRGLNFAAHNYLGLLNDESIIEDAVNAVSKYGVGSCGPRGFYGTIDVHLQLEENLAKFMRTENAVIYSYGFSTIASAIPAYSKKNDVIFADEKVNFAIQRGIEASRSTVYYFKHNDPTDLETILQSRFAHVKKGSKFSLKQRRFLVVEGLYMNTGQLCKLQKLIDIAKEYKLRIFIDESISFGVLGKHGRGITEHFDIPIDDIDLIMVSMEYSLSQIGGFCVGSTYIIEHQRLSGLGYCFSASLPPLLTAAAIRGLRILDEKPEIVESLRDKCCALDDALNESSILQTFFAVYGDRLSPLKHVALKNAAKFSYSEQVKTLKQIVSDCMSQNVILTVASYLIDKEHSIDGASIRIAVNVLLNDEDIQKLIVTLENSAVRLFS